MAAKHPEPGAIFRRGDQFYRLVEYVEHESRDGTRLTSVATVESRCAECGGLFSFTATRKHLQSKLQRRRCDVHKGPGRVDRKFGVRPAKREPEAVAIAEPVVAAARTGKAIVPRLAGPARPARRTARTTRPTLQAMVSGVWPAPF